MMLTCGLSYIHNVSLSSHGLSVMFTPGSDAVEGVSYLKVSVSECDCRGSDGPLG